METTSQKAALRFGIIGALVTAIGIILSGPVGLALVTLLAPNPTWTDAATWAAHYHPLQTFPFYGGFLLVGGYVMTMAAIYQIAEAQDKTKALTAALLTAVFATLIFFNYVNQTTFLPALAANYAPELNPIIGLFSLANPNSLCWGIEMWGYAILGAATWLTAGIFRRNRVERVTAGLMIANGVVSILGGFITAWKLSWVFTTAGLVSYALWNVLVLALAIMMIISFRARQRVV